MSKKEEYSRSDHELHPFKVIDNIEISPGVFLLTWNQTGTYLPGQVTKVAIDRTQPPRIYSICCGIKNESRSILFNIKEDGYLTPRLAACIPGDVLLVSGSYGSFRDDDSPAFWISTGTGIAPFYSMFQAGMSSQKILIHGVRHLNQFYFEDELEWALGSRYVRCCSHETSCNVYPGRITSYLLETNHFPKDYKYYLCGKSLMVVEVRDLLISKEIPYENIYAEIYF